MISCCTHLRVFEVVIDREGWSVEANPRTMSVALSTSLMLRLPFSKLANQLAPAHILQSPPDPQLNKAASQWIVPME